MAIPKGYKKNFHTLERAFKNGGVALMECRDRASGDFVAVVCAIRHGPGETIETVPFAKLFDGDPYKELISPMEWDEMNKENTDDHSNS